MCRHAWTGTLSYSPPPTSRCPSGPRAPAISPGKLAVAASASSVSHASGADTASRHTDASAVRSETSTPYPGRHDRTGDRPCPPREDGPQHGPQADPPWHRARAYGREDRPRFRGQQGERVSRGALPGLQPPSRRDPRRQRSADQPPPDEPTADDVRGQALGFQRLQKPEGREAPRGSPTPPIATAQGRTIPATSVTKGWPMQRSPGTACARRPPSVGGAGRC